MIAGVAAVASRSSAWIRYGEARCSAPEVDPWPQGHACSLRRRLEDGASNAADCRRPCWRSVVNRQSPTTRGTGRNRAAVRRHLGRTGGAAGDHDLVLLLDPDLARSAVAGADHGDTPVGGEAPAAVLADDPSVHEQGLSAGARSA